MSVENADIKKLSIALVLSGSFLVVEVIGGLLTNSLALLSDASHMLTDVMALIIAILAIKIGQRPADIKRTFGYRRIEILAAALNASFLLTVSIFIFYESAKRLYEPEQVHTEGMFAIGAVGLIANLISLTILRSSHSHNLNMKAAYLEVFADTLGTLAVLIGACVIKFTGWILVDPILAILISCMVIPRTWGLLLESVNILLNGVPKDVNIHNLYADLSAIEGVQNVHDLHVWAITSGHNSLTAHIVFADTASQKGLMKEAKEVAKKHSINHTNFQMESIHCEHDDVIKS